ncbi:MAG: class I SAM-dependent methyltransferase [Anaerolineales bacterium]|jgi:ubiquinone/menaquinone biosynthesis C-methylase UbiE|nr:class I SAM-dependent methyltransferase [Anaerolineales bacterium]MBK9779848.1 class I SAM-dependent methyltransferase [Anaerolineales bacterium]
MTSKKLRLLPYQEYKGVQKIYSVIFYYLPIFGSMYRRRVELCLDQCKGGDNILEVGFGSGLTFLNLNDNYKHIHGLDLTCDVNIVKDVFASHNIFPDLKNGDVLKMPYADNQFDTVLLISILEHLKPNELTQAFTEIKRVLKPGGQVVYGVPVERPFMVFMFRLLGYNIREHHFSTEKEVMEAAEKIFKKELVHAMKAFPAFLGNVYEIGNFLKTAE